MHWCPQEQQGMIKVQFSMMNEGLFLLQEMFSPSNTNEKKKKKDKKIEHLITTYKSYFEDLPLDGPDHLETQRPDRNLSTVFHLCQAAIAV